MNRNRRIDWRQVRALFSAGVRTDFRGFRSGTKTAPVFKTIIVYAILGGSMAAGLVQNASSFLYAVLVFGYSMLMMTLAALYEISNVPEDAELLSFHPVSTATVLAARTANLLFYTLLMGFALCFIPAWAALALPHTGWSYPAAFLLGSFLSNLFVTLLVAGMHPLLEEWLSLERFKDMLLYVQIGASFLVFFLLQVFSRAAFLPPYPDAAAVPGWFRLLPPVWFASGLSLLYGANRSTDPSLFLLGLVSILALGLMAFRSRAHRFERFAESRFISGPSRRRTGKACGIFRFWPRLKHPEARAGFALVSSLLRHDRSVKATVYPLLGIPFVFLALQFIEKGIQDPYASETSGFAPTVVLVVLAMVCTLMLSLLYSKDWESAWIFYTSPIRSPGKLYSGMKACLFTKFLFPFFILFATIYSIRIPVVHALRYALSLLIFGLIAFPLVSFFIRDYPFSRKIERGMRMKSFSWVLLALLLPVLFLWSHRTFRLNLFLWSIFHTSLFVLFLFLEKIAEKRMNSVLHKRESRV